MLYKDASVEFQKSMQRRNVSPYTISNYRICLHSLGEYIGDIKIECIQLSELRGWIDLSINKNQSPHTIWTKVVLARSFFNWCVREGLITDSPAQKLDKPKLPKRIPKALSDQETRAMLKAAQESPSPERDTALLFFFLETGARRGAVASLTIHDLTIEKGVARAITKGDKEIMLYLSKVTIEATKKWLAIRNPEQFRLATDPTSLFGLKAAGIRMVLDRLAKQAGIQHSASAHILRHTSATLRVEEGIDASSLQQIMGWADIRMAEVYTTLAQERLKRRAQETSPMQRILASD